MDETAIRAFLAGDYRRVVAAVTLVAGDSSDAEDAVQEALRRAWERGRAGEAIETPTAWIAVVAMNVARSGIRRRLAERRAVDRLVPAGTPVPSEETTEVARAVRALARRERQTVVLHYFLDLPIEEIARLLGISQGTVKKALFRARASLAKKLGQEVDA